ncbi:TIGR02594 family protein [Rhizobium leguminosarum]|uniref:TIGR02594 family protein n=1 Tax=Rhizobium leguminosarum TaxID=384 RepID=UPI000421ACEE|nr:TIGR02594 family protein [Rhizobium leguminosarum]
MQQLSGIPDANLAQVIDDLKFDGLRVISKFQAADGTWTIIAGPAGSMGREATNNNDTIDNIMPDKPPVANMDDPDPPPPGAPTQFVHARMTAPKTIVYVDAEGRKEVREGGSRAWRNCNPGNIRKGDFSINAGAIGDDGSFAIFPAEATGMAAIITLFKSRAYIDLTLKDAIFRYAPPNENDSAAYLEFIRSNTGIPAGTVLNTLRAQDFQKIAKFIQTVEGWQKGTIRGNVPPSPLIDNDRGAASAAGSATADWMTIARREAALPPRERSSWTDPEENPRILNYFKVCASWFEVTGGDEVDWCAAFVNYCLVTSGHMGTDHPGARSFFWNKDGQFAVIPSPRPGCLAVRRYAPFTDRTWREGAGHVGFVIASTSTTVTLLGGNQSNTVKESTFPLEERDGAGNVSSRFVAFLMPAIN